jgi:dihydroflavonol-4-reductase
MTRTLVTGGSGLIGGALIAELIASGHDVVALARSGKAAESVRARGAQVARGDVSDQRAVSDAAQGCELVYNVAGINTLCAPDPALMLRTNVDGAATVTRAAAQAGVRRLIHTSSAASVGEAQGTVGREDSPHRGSYLSVYERSKHLSERAVLDAATGTELEVVFVNPASVQGPGRASGTGKLLIAFLDGRLRVFIDTTISIVDVTDCVQGHVLAAQRGEPGERYLLCGATLAITEAFELASRITGVSGRPRVVAPGLARAGAGAVELAARLTRRTPPICRAMVETMLHGHRYDGSRAARELGLTYTPVEETLRATIEWATAQGLMRSRPAGPR